MGSMNPSENHQKNRDACRDRFDGLVSFFDLIRSTPSHREFTNALVEATASAPPGPALELGCGGGAALLRWREDGRPTYGLDVAPGMIKLARQNTGSPGVIADVARLPFADGSLAAVAGSLYLQLVEDQESSHREAFRVLRAGGRYAFVVPSLTWNPEEARALARRTQAVEIEAQFFAGCAATAVSSRRYGRDDVMSTLVLAGFSDVRVVPLLHGHVLCASGTRDA